MNTIEDVKLLEFNVMGDEKGSLVALEQKKQTPFDIKRIFYIYNTEQGVIRGKHANKYSEFCLIALVGSCKVKAIDIWGGARIFELNAPNRALYIPNMIWKDMYDFSSNCLLLVVSNELYNKDEYINDLDEFFTYRSTLAVSGW